VAIFASGSLSHRFAQNGLAPEYGFIRSQRRGSRRIDRTIVKTFRSVA
jgi:hypothetical protein